MVMGGDSYSKVVGLNPGAVYWMVERIVMFFQKTKINEKEADDGPF